MQRLPLSVQPFVSFIECISNLLGHSQLIVELGFGAGVAHGALYDSIGCDFAEGAFATKRPFGRI
jgi:hypothetical protein